MFQRIVVPVDGSDFSWRAFGPARALARQCVAELEVLEVITPVDDGGYAEQLLRQRLAEEDAADDVLVTVTQMGESVPATIAAHLEQLQGAMVVMSSVGRGRSAALIGSVAEDLLAEAFGPIVVVGPKCRLDREDFSGEAIVTVDGSETSETALALAAAWGIGLSARPWVVAVAEPDGDDPEGLDSAYPARLAKRLGEQSHHPVEFEVLHDEHPARAIATFAEEIGAAFVVASTHGRTGFARARVGSVAMELVHRAPCPVVLQRPPHLR
jgi:nucleotide-binding universal stress UspA family protein